jgi:prepilin-type N-terminal cleavage/methylation domain-containing protein
MLDAGYTLIEVIVVLLLIGLVGAIAIGSWLSFRQRQEVVQGASQLRRALDTAKSEASSQSVRYAVTACSNLPNSPTPDGMKYSVHPYSEPPYRFTTIENVSIIQSTVRRSPTRYNLSSQEHGNCYTAYLGLFPGDGYALGFFYLSNRQRTYIYRVGFNTIIGNIISCRVLSLEQAQCL